ncbi:hypothetical protein EXIGLDRAFT_616992 [Exidia glandulosa HHB12029]|uniref:S-adenosyl-L-methionine-dependent methyltransferase n=1 Tax=Exidia glandulosa HHB12029 TaxID=1314781 RepID=A0A165GEK8_EXIGL|nr:hypothetical protein EXIGLDRAFT_616992 [Exidia glandulosa HHB12029]
MLPAFETKHLNQLQTRFNSCHFVLKQSDNGVANGTTLWLGGQALALYFKYGLALNPHPGTSAVELGSGVGLTALAVASLGYSVLATDTALIHNAVLAYNISSNRVNLPPGSTVSSSELDWCQADCLSSLPAEHRSPSLVFTADTLYSPDLVTPLLRTMHALSSPSRATSYLCIERRDPALVDAALAEARDGWHFVLARVPHKKLVQALRKGGMTPEALERGDWDDLEIWKLTHPKPSPVTGEPVI